MFAKPDQRIREMSGTSKEHWPKFDYEDYTQTNKSSTSARLFDNGSELVALLFSTTSAVHEMQIVSFPDCSR